MRCKSFKFLIEKENKLYINYLKINMFIFYVLIIRAKLRHFDRYGFFIVVELYNGFTDFSKR